VAATTLLSDLQRGESYATPPPFVVQLALVIGLFIFSVLAGVCPAIVRHESV
jgi:hypothetical protein